MAMFLAHGIGGLSLDFSWLKYLVVAMVIFLITVSLLSLLKGR